MQLIPAQRISRILSRKPIQPCARKNREIFWMERILYFDYCAIPIFLIILFATYMRRTTRGAVNRLFLTLVWLSLATVLVDVASETLNAHSAARTAHPVLVDCFHYLYFSLRNAAIWVYLIFIYANLRTLYQLRGKLTRLLIGMPYAVLLCVLLPTRFIKWSSISIR